MKYQKQKCKAAPDVLLAFEHRCLDGCWGGMIFLVNRGNHLNKGDEPSILTLIYSVHLVQVNYAWA